MKTIEQRDLAKRVPIIEVLASFGIKPEKQVGNQLAYHSPFRSEHTASFFVNPTKNVFKDFGGDGGDVIRLVMYLKNCGYPQAIDFLLEFDGSTLNLSEIEKQALKPRKKNDFEIVSIDLPITDPKLLEYSRSRGIDDDILLSYCHQITYRNKGKTYRAIGFKNNSNGFELRANGFKSCLGKKDITTIIDLPFGTNVIVFEGFFDALSHLQIAKNNGYSVTDDIIVLNSLTMINKVNFDSYTRIYLYFDNDQSGKNHAKRIIEQYPLKTVCDMSKGYSDFKDLNEYIISIKK
jgi:DNA primase